MKALIVFIVFAATLLSGIALWTVYAGDPNELTVRTKTVDRDKQVADAANSVSPDGFDAPTKKISKTFVPPKVGEVITEFRVFAPNEKKPGSEPKEFIDLLFAGAAITTPFSETKNAITVNFIVASFDDADHFPLRCDGNLVRVGTAPGVVASAHWAAKIGESSIVATVPSTPAKTLRAPLTGNPPSRKFTSTETTATWVAGKSIVFVEKSAADIELEAVNVYSTPRWDVVRNTADAQALQQAPYPALAKLSLSTYVGKTTKMSLDAIGSFSILCYDDKNANGTWESGTEPVCYLNVVIARVKLAEETSTAKPGKASRDIVGSSYVVDGVAVGGLIFRMTHGPINPMKYDDAGLEFKADIVVVGGGGDGKLGIERVLAGWCNNMTDAFVNTGTYEGGAVVSNHLTEANAFAQSPNHITVGNLPNAITDAISGAKPILDATPHGGGRGGIRSCLVPTATGVVGAISIGERRRIFAGDSPAQMLPMIHPRFAGKRLTAAQFEFNCKAYLVIWSGAEMAMPSEPGANLFVTAAEFTWSIKSHYSIAWAVNGVPTITNGTTNTIAKSQTGTHNNNEVVPMAGRGEVWEPVSLQKVWYRNAKQ